jgi:hypothetical protein
MLIRVSTPGAVSVVYNNGETLKMDNSFNPRRLKVMKTL